MLITWLLWFSSLPQTIIMDRYSELMMKNTRNNKGGLFWKQKFMCGIFNSNYKLVKRWKHIIWQKRKICQLSTVSPISLKDYSYLFFIKYFTVCVQILLGHDDSILWCFELLTDEYSTNVYFHLCISIVLYDVKLKNWNYTSGPFY